MKTEKKERREAQLAKKAEAIQAFASDVQMQDSTNISIDGHPYTLLVNYREGFQIEKLRERFSKILTKYDYIVGDWGYDQLRLHGFYEVESKKGVPSQNIDRLEDYLYEYCNFGCAYFVLHNLEVQQPEPIPAGTKRKFKKNKMDTHRKVPSKVKKQRDKIYGDEKKYDGNKNKVHKFKTPRNVQPKKQQTKKHHFTIRQKG
ncbi:YutD family protein [Ligilactobacillus sp. WILCCON 0076]|uniref:YutD family protein n=1 Tax=Ligilactobacillus ubinensis TaxID=2876789 RepID=A0A9X2FIP6_9LACO|nr:YutD family protein [Ligilactobacillus ubinensis]MCP0886265.1 YutD family protein [Ligilactobacillus ubinensis]